MAPVDCAKAGAASMRAMVANAPIARSPACNERFDISISLDLRRVFQRRDIALDLVGSVQDWGKDLSTGIDVSALTGCRNATTLIIPNFAYFTAFGCKS